MLVLISLLVGCGGRSSICPSFPLPSEYVQNKMDELSVSDSEIREWGNKLLDLCQQLGDCEVD